MLVRQNRCTASWDGGADHEAWERYGKIFSLTPSPSPLITSGSPWNSASSLAGTVSRKRRRCASWLASGTTHSSWVVPYPFSDMPQSSPCSTTIFPPPVYSSHPSIYTIVAGLLLAAAMHVTLLPSVAVAQKCVTAHASRSVFTKL